MARTKSATSTQSSKKVGRPNQTVAAIREMALQQNEREKRNYEKGVDSLRKMRDPLKNYTDRIRTYSKEEIIEYLKNLSSHQKDLREIMHYMYMRSQIMNRLINWYAGIWDLRCRKVTPKCSLTENNNLESMLASFEKTLNMLDIYKVHENMYAPLLRSYLDDVVYALWFRDDKGAFPYILKPDYCKIVGKYSEGDFAFAIDMSKFSGTQKDLIEWLGSPLTEMYDEYQATGERYIRVPKEYNLCLKYRIDDIDTIVSPFAPELTQLAGLCELENIQDIADKQSIFKLLVCAIKTISGSKIADDWQITPDIIIDYIKSLNIDIFPEWVTAVPILGDGLDVLDFSKSVSDTDVNRVKNAQNNILNISGGGAVLSSSNITSTAAFNAWLKSESEFAISTLMPQITGFVNRMLSYDVSDPCKVDFFELTVLTKDDFRKSLLESNQYGYSYRLAYGTLLGFSEKETIASLMLESEILKLQDKMIFPLRSSFTSTSNDNGYTNETGQGRPSVDDSELSPEGERSRNR